MWCHGWIPFSKMGCSNMIYNVIICIMLSVIDFFDQINIPDNAVARPSSDLVWLLIAFKQLKYNGINFNFQLTRVRLLSSCFILVYFQTLLNNLLNTSKSFPRRNWTATISLDIIYNITIRFVCRIETSSSSMIQIKIMLSLFRLSTKN